MATLTVTATHNYTADTLINIDSIVFATAGFAQAQFDSTQFGPGKISNSVAITGDGNDNEIAVLLNNASFSAAAWTFSNWTSSFLDDEILLLGSSNAQTITGSTQADDVFGQGGADTIHTGGGNDAIEFDAGEITAGATIDGGAGIDDINLGTAGSYDLRVMSISGFERLDLANSGITATVAADQLGAGKINQVIGNAGTTQSFIATGSTVDLSGITFTAWGGANQTISITGTAGIDNLKGSAQKDTLKGGGGADTLNGGIGADTMVGGAADDLYYVDNAADRVFEGAGGGTDKVVTSVSFTLGADQEIETFTPISFNTTTDIDFTGNALAQAITGNAGKNTISDGGAGAVDTLKGLGGNDLYVVNNTGDTVTEAAGGGTDRVATSVSFTLGAGQEIETLAPVSYASVTNIDFTGNALAQAIFGNAGDNVIDGKGSADTMTGLGGDDLYFVDNAGDAVAEAAAGGNDRVITSVSYALQAGQSVEVFTTSNMAAVTAINLTGNDLAQGISGNAGDNIFDGKGGNDNFVGAGGNNTYVFDTAPATLTNNDTITDFSVADDMIDLSHAIYTAIPIGALSSDAFFIGAAAHDATDRVIYNAGALLYDADGNGAGASVQFATLSSGLALTAAQFQVTA